MPLILPIAVGVIVAGFLVALGVRAGRRRKQLPELNQHPERLEQMLDPTDDA